ncbi:MAG: hypothetical protein K8S87_07920 [Planctomycetes bacterium]|nr:hypothetical protein [Planctomycetota bacterium]
MEHIIVISRDKFGETVNMITLQEWRTLVDNHESMVWVGGELKGFNPKTHEEIKLNGTGFAKYHSDDEDTIFKFDDGRIAIHNPSESDIPKMKEIAEMLGAQVIDSQNKIY